MSFTPLPSLICGVIFRLVPTSSRWIVWNGFTLPLLPLPVLEYWPGEERHFLADLDLGFLVVERHDMRRRDDVRVGVAVQRVDRTAAQLVPVSLILPMPNVMPSRITPGSGVPRRSRAAPAARCRRSCSLKFVRPKPLAVPLPRAR